MLTKAETLDHTASEIARLMAYARHCYAQADRTPPGFARTQWEVMAARYERTGRRLEEILRSNMDDV